MRTLMTAMEALDVLFGAAAPVAPAKEAEEVDDDDDDDAEEDPEEEHEDGGVSPDHRTSEEGQPAEIAADPMNPRHRERPILDLMKPRHPEEPILDLMKPRHPEEPIVDPPPTPQVSIGPYWPPQGAYVEVLLHFPSRPRTPTTAADLTVIRFPRRTTTLTIHKTISNLYLSSPLVPEAIKTYLRPLAAGTQYLFILTITALGLRETALWQAQLEAGTTDSVRLYCADGYLTGTMVLNVQHDCEWNHFVTFLRMLNVEHFGAAVEPKLIKRKMLRDVPVSVPVPARQPV
ncbi:hypothetical protein DFH27DRAFT_338578 [Peziza echinospora]|nr:hypothetical protein DFH27DRAFT_338578 [Peziza echinospora]